MRALAATAALILFSGCADTYLSQAEEDAFSGRTGQLKPAVASTLHEAAQSAFVLSAAFYEAAQNTQVAQDVVSAGVVVTAASVVAGSISGSSDKTLSNRGLAGVALQQSASRGLGRTSIESLYDGAQTLNCVGVVATIYQNDPVLSKDDKAPQIVTGIIREVRINARKGLTRDVANYSSLITAFEAVLRDDKGTESVSANRVSTDGEARSASTTRLEQFLTRLGGCVKAKQVSNSKPNGAG